MSSPRRSFTRVGRDPVAGGPPARRRAVSASLDAGHGAVELVFKTLRDAGIVNDRKEGRWVYYSLNGERLSEARAVLEALRPSRRALRTVCC